MNSTDPHLTRAEIDRILDQARYPDPVAEAANAHLKHCEQCRRALRSQAPAIESGLTRLFSQIENADGKPDGIAFEAGEWKELEWSDEEWLQEYATESAWPEEAAHITQENLSRYVAGELLASEIKQTETHLNECRLCRREVRELRELHSDAEALLQSLAAPIVAAPQSTPPVADPVPASSRPDLDSAEPAEAATVDTPPADTKTTVWQRWRENWLPNSVLAPKFLFPLTTGAVFAASVLIIGLLLPMRQRLYAKDAALEAQKKAYVKETSDLNARLQVEHETAQQSQTQLAQAKATLQQKQHELQVVQEKLKPGPLGGAVLLAESATGEQLYHDKQSVIRRSQPLKAALSNSLLQTLKHPETALAEGRTQLDAVASKPERTMGGQETTAAIALLAPVSRIVSSSTPQFQWRSLSGSLHYQVQIREEKTGLELPENKPVTTTTWTPTKPLNLGITYVWQVVATNDKGEETARSANGKFKVLDAQTAAQIDSVSEFSLLCSLLYVKAGMSDEAEREWKKLPQADRRSPLAGTLQQQIQALRQSSKSHP